MNAVLICSGDTILGSSRMTRESQLVDKDVALIQQRRDSGPLRGRNLEVRTCVLDKGDPTFRFIKEDTRTFLFVKDTALA